MAFDFDREIPRYGTNSVKYDFAAERGMEPDVLPMWIADMDFAAPDCVLQALRRAVDHGVFGYSEVKEDYYRTVAAWFSERFGFETRPEWLVKSPGVVVALATAVRALTKPGDAVLIQPPVYYPFYQVIRSNGRRLEENPLLYRAGRYEMDLDDLEEKLRRTGAKLLILCSPHNPVCRVWSREELAGLGELCRRYGAYVLSDEIHCDFTAPGHPHTMFLQACPELAERTVLCTAPSKTFNLAGLQLANIWIPGEDVRRRFREALDRTGYSQLNGLGLVAAQAAYAGGGPWLEECRRYICQNQEHMRRWLAEHLPAVRMCEPEGTYFAWVDFSGLGLDKNELNGLFARRAKVWLDAGEIFGQSGAQFQRFVLACTRKTLDTALGRIQSVL